LRRSLFRWKRDGEDEDCTGDFIPDDDAPAPAEAAAFSLLRKACGRARYADSGRKKCCAALRSSTTDARALSKKSQGILVKGAHTAVRSKSIAMLAIHRSNKLRTFWITKRRAFWDFG
jgi:RNA polymerase primary sigma factor